MPMVLWLPDISARTLSGLQRMKDNYLDIPEGVIASIRSLVPKPSSVVGEHLPEYETMPTQ